MIANIGTNRLKVLTRRELKSKACVVLGTRPGIVKQAPVIRGLQNAGVDFFVIHTGQHYSYDMDAQFFDELGLPAPQYRLASVRRFKTHAGQTAAMLKGVEAALLIEKPRVVLVGGDANTNLAGALAARKLQLVVGHVEAGLRSYDWRMPEEHNRVMIDHISDLLFPPTETARANLEREQVRGKILVTGNTVVDALQQNLEVARQQSRVLERLDVAPHEFAVLTVHREENVDNRENMQTLVQTIQALAERLHPNPMVFPVHPRTVRRFRQFGLDRVVAKLPGLKMVSPLGYLDFLLLEASSSLVLTDSGGVQEEACILGVPCVTLRTSTERPETVSVGANAVAGLEPAEVIAAVDRMLSGPRGWENPFGDGKAGSRIAGAVHEVLLSD